MDLPARESGGVTEDVRTLHALGYRQELWRRMSAFSNYAISLSIICILAGGVTSFHLGLCSVGGASIGLGWPLASLLALAFAATMGQLASAFPTAGGLYHWAAILGGRGWGWATAWFNLAGLITVLAAINVGTYLFVQGALGPWLGFNPGEFSEAKRMMIQIAGVHHHGLRRLSAYGGGDRGRGACRATLHHPRRVGVRAVRLADAVRRGAGHSEHG
ncbi:MAG TPA: amino acid permease [Gemmataceae bacterium]|jgi:amino acid transporter|nr:amino acid permease [Gemmataceae bacterium]